jgi:hypothetical protein
MSAPTNRIQAGINGPMGDLRFPGAAGRYVYFCRAGGFLPTRAAWMAFPGGEIKVSRASTRHALGGPDLGAATA